MASDRRRVPHLTKAGEFGIQFTNVDDDQAKMLAALLDRSDGEAQALSTGARVRLHIDGLGGPMRGVVRHPSDRKLVVGSEIAFLQLGRDLPQANSWPRPGRAILFSCRLMCRIRRSMPPPRRRWNAF